MKKNIGKGFTLAELLIVIAIIAVLVAIAIPVFTSQLERSREATDLANIRGIYAEVMTEVLTDETQTYSASVDLEQKQTGWQTAGAENTLKKLAGENVQGTPQKDGKATVIWEEGVLSIIFEGALPITISESDYSNPARMNELFGEIVSFLQKNFDMPRLNSRSEFCGSDDNGKEKVEIITVQTGDGQTQKEIKDAMRNVGYSDTEIEKLYQSVHYAYLDADGNLLGYHGSGSGGRSQLYIVGYDDNPVSVGGAQEAKDALAKFVQDGTLS